MQGLPNLEVPAWNLRYLFYLILVQVISNPVLLWFQVEYALKFPFYTTLERLDHKRNINILMLEVLTSWRHNTCKILISVKRLIIQIFLIRYHTKISNILLNQAIWCQPRTFLLWLLKISHFLNLSTRANSCIFIGLGILLSGHANFLCPIRFKKKLLQRVGERK